MKVKVLLPLLTFMFILIGGFAYTYVTLNKPVEKKPFVVRNDDFNDGDSEEVVERTVVIKNVYVDDYSGYADSEESSSYWYVQFRCKNKADGQEWKGFSIFQLNTSYFDLKAMQKNVWAEATDNDYVEINFFKRVSFESFKKYHE